MRTLGTGSRAVRRIQALEDGIGIDGLDQVNVKPGLCRLIFVLLSSPACYRNQRDISSPRFLPDAAGRFVTIELRHTHIEYDHFGTKLLGLLEGFQAIEGGLHIVA